MKPKNAFYIIIALILASCSLSGSDSSVQPNIVGEWKWVKSTGGFAGKTVSPDSTGYSPQILVYTSRHTFSLLKADTLAIKGTYSLVNTEGKTLIRYKPSNDNSSYFPSQIVETENDDLLILTEECFDCFIHTYKRSK